MTTANNITDPPTLQFDDETIPVFAHWFGSWRISLQRRALSVPQLTGVYDRAAPDWSRFPERRWKKPGSCSMSLLPVGAGCRSTSSQT